MILEHQELKRAAERDFSADHLLITDVTSQGVVHLRGRCRGCGKVMLFSQKLIESDIKIITPRGYEEMIAEGLCRDACIV